MAASRQGGSMETQTSVARELRMTNTAFAVPGAAVVASEGAGAGADAGGAEPR